MTADFKEALEANPSMARGSLPDAISWWIAGDFSSWLLDSYSGRKLDLPSTGNAARSAGSAPGVSATNLWIEPGEARLEELIQDTPRGLAGDRTDRNGIQPRHRRLFTGRRRILDRKRAKSRTRSRRSPSRATWVTC